MGSTNEEMNENDAVEEPTAPSTWPLPTPPDASVTMGSGESDVHDQEASKPSNPNWELGADNTAAREAMRDDPWSSDEDKGFSPPLEPRRRSGLRNLVAVAAVASLIGGLVGAGIVALNGGEGKGGHSYVTVHDASSPPAVLPNGASIPNLVRTVLPSIVSIESSGDGSQDQGTGMVISEDGLVLTNNHVIANAASGGTITVTQSGQTERQAAALIGRDPSNDVALIQIVGAHDLTPLVFAKSRLVVVGTAVVAIGNALGLAAGTPTVTSGIVSALGRAVDASDGSSTESLTNMIQTDAAINPGNSGGPLLNARGEVIGMNTAVAGSTSDGTSAQNIGFAIPSDHLTDLLPKLEKGGTAVSTKAFLGVYLLSMTPQLQQQYGFKTSKGAIIAEVNPGSPAEIANLQQGDVIVEANGQVVETADDLSSIIMELHPGDRLRLTYIEDGKKLKTTAVLGTKA